MSSEVKITHTCDRQLVSQSPKDLLQAHKDISRPLWQALEKKGSGKVFYDLTSCPKMDSGALLLLFYSAHALKRIGWEAYLLRGRGESYEMVAENIEHLKLPAELQKTVTTRPGEFLCRMVPKREQMVDQLQNWAETVEKGTSADKAEVALWQMQVSEVTTNSFQHGNLVAPRILVAGKAHQHEKLVQLAALDFGSGIPKSIEAVAMRAKIPDGDGNYIRHACCKGVTSRSVPQNQGAGLNSLVETVKEKRGSLLIFSGNGMFHVTNGRRYGRNYPAENGSQAMIDGTLIILNLRLS